MTPATRLRSVNVGLPRAFSRDGRELTTGIFKEPVAARVAVRRLGLEGDGQADLVDHGGPDKAVYAYSFANTLHWRAALSRPELDAGSFGENLTLDDLPDSVAALGDVLRIGSALLQITQPRQPCVKLALKLGLPQFPKQFTASGRVGFYLRVLEEGAVARGDAVAWVEREAEPLPVEALNAAVLVRDDAADVLRRALASPALSGAWRQRIERRLARG